MTRFFLKKVFFTLLGALVFTSSFALKVHSEVYKVGVDEDGKACCYYMVHLFYDDDGNFLSYGTSGSGECCSNSSAQIDPNNNLDDDQIAELVAFSLTPEFQTSQQDAIAVYIASKGLGYLDMDVLRSKTEGNVNIVFNSSEEGKGSLTIAPMMGGNILKQTVDVVKNMNSLEISYALNSSVTVPQYYLVTILVGKEVFRTLTRIS